MQGRSLAPGAIIDINNDGKLEYILSTQQGNLLALDNDGEVIFDHQFDNRTINVTPAFGDVHGSSKNLEMVVTGGESGFTYCFSTSAIKDAISHWPTYRGNIQNTGSWFGLTKSNILRMVPVNLAWDKALAGEDIVFSIYNPNPSDEFFNANATCIRPDGSKQKSISKVIGKMGQLQMSVNFDIPGSYAFTWSLTDQKDRVLVKGEKEITIMPLSNERKLIEYAISELTIASQKVESILPLSAKALENQRLILELNAKILAIGSNQKSSANISMAKLVKDAKRALELSSIIEGATAFGQSTSLIAFEGTKWDSRNVGKQLPAMIENPLILSHDVVPGEHQPISLKLFNITNQTLQVKVEIGETEKNIKVTPLYSVLTLSSLGKNSWDALPEMDESGVISIPSLSTREVWMDVNIGEVKTGHHNITIHLYALNGAGVIDAPNNPHAVPAPETKVELTLNVLPFNMAPSGDFRLCTWSPSSGPVIEDLLAHGNNVFIIPQGRLTYKNDEFMDVDFTEIGDIIDQFEETDVFLLSYGLPAIKGEFGT
ncbi:MAG TPA: hypothetical protein ENL10_00340, partial [Candidatus Cloacimonetes bacterium]|nr:hypothetical protein [Candidatus Cloacimonadota bacterium]